MNGHRPFDSVWRWSVQFSPIVLTLRAVGERARPHRKAAATIEASGLPTAIGNHISHIIRRTRLYTSERQDIAREFIAHAWDAHDAGRSEPEVLVSLGDPKPIAALLKRAAMRKRPLICQVRTWTIRAALVTLGAGALLYAGLTVRFYTSSPTIRTNYLARLNAPILAAPESDRAWPVYEEALVEWYKIEAYMLSVSAMDRDSEDLNRRYAGVESFPIILKEHPDRADTIGAMKAYRPTLDRIAEAAKRPMVGMLLSPNTRDIQIPGASRTLTVTTPPTGEAADQPSLVETIIPHFMHTRHIARMLAFDCNIAIEERDAQRAYQDLIAMLNLGDQIGSEPFLMGKLVGIAIHSFTVNQIYRVYALAPALLSREHTIGLARQLATSSANGSALDLDQERAMFLDVLQRSFTDDGRGGGRLTPAGVRLVQTLTEAPLDFGFITDEAPWILRSTLSAATPLAGASVVGRRKQLRKYDELLAEVQRALDEGPRGIETFHNWSRSNFKPLRSGMLPRWSPLIELTPSYNKLLIATMRLRSEFDATLVLLAADTYRIEHDAWPESLEQLVPDYLSTIPDDPFLQGAQILYRADASGPTIWFRGPDADDDNAYESDDLKKSSVGHLLRLRYEQDLDDIPHTDAVIFPPHLD